MPPRLHLGVAGSKLFAGVLLVLEHVHLKSSSRFIHFCARAYLKWRQVVGCGFRGKVPARNAHIRQLLYTRKRTFLERVGMFAKGERRTLRIVTGCRCQAASMSQIVVSHR